MNYALKITLLFSAVFALTSCDKDPDQVGCTDQYAVNYDPSAL